jgi:hypothetical protein
MRKWGRGLPKHTKQSHKGPRVLSSQPRLQFIDPNPSVPLEPSLGKTREHRIQVTVHIRCYSATSDVSSVNTCTSRLISTIGALWLSRARPLWQRLMHIRHNGPQSPMRNREVPETSNSHWTQLGIRCLWWSQCPPPWTIPLDVLQSHRTIKISVRCIRWISSA